MLKNERQQIEDFFIVKEKISTYKVKNREYDIVISRFREILDDFKKAANQKGNFIYGLSLGDNEKIYFTSSSILSNDVVIAYKKGVLFNNECSIDALSPLLDDVFFEKMLLRLDNYKNSDIFDQIFTESLKEEIVNLDKKISDFKMIENIENQTILWELKEKTNNARKNIVTPQFQNSVHKKSP